MASGQLGTPPNPFGEIHRQETITGFDISANGQVVYANARESFFIYSSTDAGNTWSQSEINQANGPIAVSPTDDKHLLYAGSGRLYRSTDGLMTTQKVLDAPATLTDVVIAPPDTRVVYAITEGYWLYKSTDSGESFILLSNLRSDVLNQQP